MQPSAQVYNKLHLFFGNTMQPAFKLDERAQNQRSRSPKSAALALALFFQKYRRSRAPLKPELIFRILVRKNFL
jgi:hypothetical protein